MDHRRELMRELRWIVAGARRSRPDMLEAFHETLRLADLGERAERARRELARTRPREEPAA